MVTNQAILAKIDTTLAQLAAGGQLLRGQPVRRFVQLAILEPAMTKDVWVTPMGLPREERNTIRFAGQVLHPAAELLALPTAQRVSPGFGLFQLDAVEYKATAVLSDSAAEDSIERGAFLGTVMSELAKAVGRDMERVAIQGDVTSAVPLLATQDGWIARANVNQVAGGGAQLGVAALRDARELMPDEFDVDERLSFYTNPHARHRYIDAVRARATPLGDATFRSNDSVSVFEDVRIKKVPLFPNALGVGVNETAVLLADPKVFVIGFWRKIRIETERDARAGANSIIATVRFAITTILPGAIVRINAILGQ